MPLRASALPPLEPRPGFRAVGRVERPWGLRGHVKVLPLTDFPERFASGATIFLGGEERTVLEDRWQKGRVYLRLTGIDSLNAAEALRGQLAEVRETAVMPLDKDEYFVDQIEGCEVLLPNGSMIGTVREVIQPGANDVYVVGRSGRKDLLVPAIRDVVLSVDVDAQVIVVDPPPGLDPESMD